MRRYPDLMPGTFRRVAAVLLALTLVVGQMSYALRAADAGAQMVMTVAGDVPMSHECDGCGDHRKAMTSAACSAFCASFAALPSTDIVLELSLPEAFEGFAGPLPTGQTIPPDPYPPRPAVPS